MTSCIFCTNRAAQEVIEQLFRQDVRYVRLYFPDPLGRVKGQNVSRDQIWKILQRGQGFDGSSIEGFVRIQESDKIALPMPETFRILPYPVDGQRVGVMFCRVLDTDRAPFAGDSFLPLERALVQMREMGYETFFVGPELEFFLFKQGSLEKGVPQLVHSGGYFDEGVTHPGAVCRMKIVEAFHSLGIKVEGDHGEVADSQNEIDLEYQDAWTMAWWTLLYRVVAREIAESLGMRASFMPKPITGVNGSGMHMHLSLFRKGHNAFFDADDPYSLSTVARQFMAGIFKYLPEGMLIFNQWVNSFNRLVPGYEAPVYLCWGRRNRSALIRVPEYQRGQENATRIELRNPDPGCNTPLAIATVLQMGLRGITEQLDCLPAAVEEDVFQLTDDERKARGIKALPGSFTEALNAFETSEFMKSILGEHMHTRIVASKRDELNTYQGAIKDDVSSNEVSDQAVVLPGAVRLYSKWL
ncbi:MAG: glutamine synthetase family protein [Patescibacteria group bacterium]